ncbi:MAG TPA: hypothetical protein VHN99_01975 [Deinococcales bacterium]|nr:hypothetical protein [Deinococcales bacterium]
MKRSTWIVLVLLAVVAVGIAVFPRPKAAPAAVAAAPSQPGETAVTLPAMDLSGKVELGPGLAASGVTASIGGLVVADVPIKNGTYRLALPGRLVSAQLSSLDQVRLVDGYGALHPTGADAQGNEVVLQAYQDSDKNGHFDGGEPKLPLTLFPADKAAGYEGFFRYELLALSAPASLVDVQDTPSGAKGFYRYQLDNVPAGYSVLEGELADNGYDIRLRPGGDFNLIPKPTPGSKGPPAFNTK